MARAKLSPSAQSTATIGFEAKLWPSVDQRWHGAAAEKEQPKVDPQGAARQRRQFGVPPKGNANFAWVQHFIHHLAPGGAGTAGACPGDFYSRQGVVLAHPATRRHGERGRRG